MVARPWSSSRLSCGERLLLRCDGNAGNLSPRRRERIPPLELGGGNGAPLDVGRTLVLPLERTDPFPAWSGKNSRFSSRISRGGALHRKGERNSRVGPPFPESPRCLFIPRKPVFPALPRLSSRGSTHTTVARGTALWESLVGKPSGKP